MVIISTGIIISHLRRQNILRYLRKSDTSSLIEESSITRKSPSESSVRKKDKLIYNDFIYYLKALQIAGSIQDLIFQAYPFCRKNVNRF